MSFKDNHPLLHRISDFMDNKFEVLGIKFGFDFLIGLIPVWGNVLTTCVSLFTVVYSAFHGISAVVLLRMLLNISLDMFFTAVPILGNFADIFWKANDKNYKLLEDYTLHPEKTVKRSWIASFAILAFYLSLLIAVIYGIYRLTVFLFHWIQSLL